MVTTDEAPEMPRPATISVSAADTYDKCPRQWHAKYVLRLEDPSGPEAIAGTLTHTVLEHLAAEPPERRNLRTAASIADLYWPEVDAALRAKAMAFVSLALKLPTSRQPGTVVAERRVETELAGIPFVGIIDLTETTASGAAIVTDWKTGKRPDRADWLEPKLRQVTLYAAAVEAHDKRPVAEGRIVWIPIGHIDVVPITRSAITEAVDWLGNIWTSIEQDLAEDRFDPSPGPLCSWCPACGDCPEGMVAIRARAKRPGKSLGDHGIAALAAEAEQGSSPTTL